MQWTLYWEKIVSEFKSSFNWSPVYKEDTCFSPATWSIVICLQLCVFITYIFCGKRDILESDNQGIKFISKLYSRNQLSLSVFLEELMWLETNESRNKYHWVMVLWITFEESFMNQVNIIIIILTFTESWNKLIWWAIVKMVCKFDRHICLRIWM